MKSKHTLRAFIGMQTRKVSRIMMAVTIQPVSLAVVLFIFTQIGLVCASPATIRANTTIFKPTTSTTSHQAQPMTELTDRTTRSRDQRLAAPPKPEQSYQNERAMLPMSPFSTQQGVQTLSQAPASNAHLSPYRPTSQVKELPINKPTRYPARDYALNFSSPNLTDRHTINTVYPPIDLVSEGSGSGPLDSNLGRPNKLDDTEEGDDDDDENDYDDKDTSDNNPENDNSQNHQIGSRPANVHPTSWPSDPVDPYAPFKRPSHLGKPIRPPQESVLSSRPNLQPALEPQQNLSRSEQVHLDSNSQHAPIHQKPSTPAPMTSTLAPMITNIIAQRPNPTNDQRVELQTRANQSTIVSDKFNKAVNNVVSSRPDNQIPSRAIPSSDLPMWTNSTNATSNDFKSKDQDVDYDYEEEMDEDDSEDSSTFEDGEPLDLKPHDNNNRTSSNYPTHGNDNQQQHIHNNSYLSFPPSSINNTPAREFSTTTQPSISIFTSSSPTLDSTSKSPPSYDADAGSDNPDYNDEDDEEEAEEEEDDLSIEEDDLDNEDDIDLNADGVKNKTTFPNVAPIPTELPPIKFTLGPPVKFNSNSQQTGVSQVDSNRSNYDRPILNKGTNQLDHRSEQPKQHLTPLDSIPNGLGPTTASSRTTTSPPKIYQSSTPQSTTSTSTSATMLTIKPTPVPATTRAPALTNWLNTQRPTEAVPPIKIGPDVVNYGTSSVEDDTDLTRQIYDKAVELYQTVHKAMVATYDAVWQPNFDLSSSAFEPLLSQPLFFMCKYSKQSQKSNSTSLLQNKLT